MPGPNIFIFLIMTSEQAFSTIIHATETCKAKALEAQFSLLYNGTMNIYFPGRAWGLTSVISALGRLGQEECHEPTATRDYTVNFPGQPGLQSETI